MIVVAIEQALLIGIEAGGIVGTEGGEPSRETQGVSAKGGGVAALDAHHSAHRGGFGLHEAPLKQGLAGERGAQRATPLQSQAVCPFIEQTLIGQVVSVAHVALLQTEAVAQLQAMAVVRGVAGADHSIGGIRWCRHTVAQVGGVIPIGIGREQEASVWLPFGTEVDALLIADV